mmetsp:Transcript_15017/g.32777  ORF Transcript_15017/g.32777 Transcript_15017/m.32777 type:complete len:97 (+) Transcript_15017:1219-1509(+)
MIMNKLLNNNCKYNAPIIASTMYKHWMKLAMSTIRAVLLRFVQKKRGIIRSFRRDVDISRNVLQPGYTFYSIGSRAWGTEGFFDRFGTPGAVDHII